MTPQKALAAKGQRSLTLGQGQSPSVTILIACHFTTAQGSAGELLSNQQSWYLEQFKEYVHSLHIVVFCHGFKPGTSFTNMD